MKSCVMVVASFLSVATLIACEGNIDDSFNNRGGMLKIQVSVNSEPLKGSLESRTYIGTYNETENSILWGKKESLKIGVLGDGDVSKVTWATQTTSDYDGLPTALFSFSVTPAYNNTGSTYTYVGICPTSASLDESSVIEHRVNLKTAQDATADSYDPEAYILVAKPDAGHTVANANWEASFRRATALNKLTLKNLPEAIESVQIIAPKEKKLTGYQYVDLSTGYSGEVYNGDNTVTVNYVMPNAGTVKEGVNCKTVWFTSWDTEISEGEELTIIARSATKFYSRTITARTGGIQFREGYLNTLGVNMASATVSYKEYDLSLQSNTVVYDNDSHAAFTAIYSFEDRMLMAFREGRSHRPASVDEYGVVKIMEKNGTDWVNSATISDATKDLRDPFFTEIDGHLRVYMGYNTFEDGHYQHSGTAYSDCINGVWSEVRTVTHNLNHIAWLWKVRPYRNKYYSIAYLEGEKPVLMFSENGVDWTTQCVIDLEGILTEADMCFVGETMYVCLRKDTPITEPSYWGVSQYPFTSFTWSEMENHIESPDMLWLPYANSILLAGRERRGTQTDVTLFSASLDGKLETITNLKTGEGGDKGYPGLLYQNGILHCCYYSGITTMASVSLATWNVNEQ